MSHFRGCFFRFVFIVVFVFVCFVFGLLVSFKSYSMTNNSIIEAVNNYRINNNLEPLTYNNDMQFVSDVRADESISVWSHTRPDGTPYYTINDLIYGENLAYGYSSESELMTAWINSETHNRNLLEPRFKTVCVGIAGDHVALEFGM